MKPLVKTVATTAVVLAGLAGCASRSSGGSSAAGAGSGGSSTSSSSSSAGQTPSTSPSSTGQTGTPNPSNPSGPATVKYVAVQGLSLQKDGVTLVTEVNWGGCNEQPTLVIKSQDASKVVIEEKTVSHYRVGVMCPDFSRDGQASVKLDAPLGSRQVIDGVKNVAISVS